jgi:hypothetical protein
METVEVDKMKLVQTLEKNKADHVKEFEEAWDAYAEKLVANLTAMLDAAKSGDVAEVQLHINLTKPENHEADYDRAIEMLEWEVHNTVELQEHEFANLVQDNWGWARIFAESYHSNTGRFSKLSQ